MKTNISRTVRAALFTTVAAAAVGVTLAACSSGEPAGSNAADRAEEPAMSAQAATALSFDTKGIATHPEAALPPRPLTTGAFALANVQRGLLQSGEPFTAGPRTSSRATFDAASWHAEIDATRGQVLAVSQLTPGAPMAQSDRAMQAAAQKRLALFGVPSEEIVTFWQKRAMTADEQDGAYGKPEVDGYKTFAVRGINGVRIRGHRAVLTHGADGAFRRALVKWPALAASGHKLRSALSTADIVTRATRALQAEGITAGAVTLQWTYVPTELKSGEVTLTLEAVATVPYSAELGEARVVEVGVDAS